MATQVQQENWPGSLDRSRWGIAAAAIVMQLALGAVYAWSVFVIPLQGLNHGWSRTDIGHVALEFEPIRNPVTREEHHVSTLLRR